MMEAPPDAPLSVRLGAKIGPEVVASILVAAVVIVAVMVAVSGRQSPAAVSSAEPSSAAVSSAAASVVAVPSGTPVAPSPSPSPSASPSAAPVVSVAASLVLEIVDRLLGQRAELQAEVAKSNTDAVAIAELLRNVNASLVALDTPLTDLAADSSTGDLAVRIRAVNATTFDAVRRAQRSTIRNEKAYRQGAIEVVAALEPLTAIRAELAALVGGSTSPQAQATQATGTADPSGATP
jgi:hypothetical protein